MILEQLQNEGEFHRGTFSGFACYIDDTCRIDANGVVLYISDLYGMRGQSKSLGV